MLTTTITADTADTATPFLTEKQAAERLALSPYTLRNWRSSGTGPPTLKLGGAVRYHLPALDAWTLGQVA